MIDPFINYGDWFSAAYRVKSDCRFVTFKAALNLLHQLPTIGAPRVIVETGCARVADDWGGGQSTLLFADYLRRYGGMLYSVDLSQASCEAAIKITAPYSDFARIQQDDSVNFLKNWNTSLPIDLLYLDSFDYPYGQLLDLYGGRNDIAAAERRLNAMTEAEIVEKHGDIILPCQQHCLNELEAGLPVLRKDGILLIDDNSLAGGGKPRLAKQRLVELGWTCVYDYQATLWIKR